MRIVQKNGKVRAGSFVRNELKARIQQGYWVGYWKRKKDISGKTDKIQIMPEV